MMERRFPIAFIGSLILAVAGLGMHFLATDTQAVGPLAPNQMALDATAGGSVNASASVSGTAAFSAGLHITQIQGPYAGYNWQLRFPTSGLTFVAGSAVENTAATTLNICNAPAIDTTTIPGTTIVGANSAGCITFGSPTSFLGQVTTFSLQCAADGAMAVTLVDTLLDATNGSSVQDTTGQVLDTGTAGITINCSDTGAALPTATATATATQTFTPGPTQPPTATSTPCVGTSCSTPTLPPDFTRTATPASTGTATVAAGTPASTQPPAGGTPPPPRATSTRPVGAPGGTINGPDTGSGGQAWANRSDGTPLTVLAIALALPAVMAAAGWLTMRRSVRGPNTGN